MVTVCFKSAVITIDSQNIAYNDMILSIQRIKRSQLTVFNFNHVKYQL